MIYQDRSVNCHVALDVDTHILSTQRRALFGSISNDLLKNRHIALYLERWIQCVSHHSVQSPMIC